MTKDIKQIQEENRKLILEIVEPDGFYEEPINENPILRNWKITLSRVLLALVDYIELNAESLHGKWLNMWWKIGEPCIAWDLTKEILEEQSEETQIAINQLLTK